MVKAQERHEEDEGTTRKGNVEEEGEETNSMQEKNHVSSRHMTWWQESWWVRRDNGQHLRTAQRPSTSVACSHKSRARDARY